jgi:hypothetical protein
MFRLRTGRQPEPEGNRGESFVIGPETGVRRQDSRGQQMRVDESNAATEQAVILDQDEHLGVRCRSYLWKIPQEPEDFIPPGQVNECELP